MKFSPALTKLCYVFSDLAFYLYLVVFNLRPIQSLDIGWHLASGRYILAHHLIPWVDPFSWVSPGTRWVDSYWLTEVLLFAGVRLAGLAGLIVGKALFVVIILFIQDLLLREEKIPGLWRAGVLLGLFFSAHPRGYGWSEQASLVTLFFLSLLFWHLERFRKTGWKTIFVLWPIVFMVWANMHRGFILGLGVAACYMLLEQGLSSKSRVQRAGWLILCGLMTLMTPYGVHLFWMIWQDLTFSPVHIAGWAHPPWQHLELFWISVGMFWAILAIKTFRGETIAWSHLGVALFLTWTGTRFVANGPYTMLFMWPYMAVTTWSWIKQSKVMTLFERYEKPMAMGLAVMFLIMAIRFPVEGGMNHRVFPVVACDFIDREKIPGPFYNDYAFGGYWLWRFAETRPVFIDGRYPAVEGYQILFQDIETAKTGTPQDWGNFLNHHHVESVLIMTPRTVDALTMVVSYFPRATWALVYGDRTAMVYMRRNTANRRLIQWHEKA